MTDLIEEYNDRVERLKTTEKSLEDLSQEQTVLTSKINHKHQYINNINKKITKKKNRQEILVDLVENKSIIIMVSRLLWNLLMIIRILLVFLEIY